jgi:hypothetical protein
MPYLISMAFLASIFALTLFLAYYPEKKER